MWPVVYWSGVQRGEVPLYQLSFYITSPFPPKHITQGYTSHVATVQGARFRHLRVRLHKKARWLIR